MRVLRRMNGRYDQSRILAGLFSSSTTTYYLRTLTLDSPAGYFQNLPAVQRGNLGAHPDSYPNH